MPEGFDIDAFRPGYLAEVEEHLQLARRSLAQAAEAASSGRSSVRPVREAFRALHTIKGLSAMVGVEPVVEIAHAAEAVLRRADRTGGLLPPGAVDVLGDALEAIERRVRAVERSEPVPAAPAAVIEAVRALSIEPTAAPEPGAGLELPPELRDRLGPGELQQLAGAAAEGRRAVLIRFAPSPTLAAEGVGITTIRTRLSELGELVRVLPVSGPPSDEAPTGLRFLILLDTEATDEALSVAASVPAGSIQALTLGPAPETPAPGGTDDAEDDDGELQIGAAGGRVRVEVGRLDAAMEHLGALVTTRFRLERAMLALRDKGVDTRQLQEVLRVHQRQVRDLRGALMQARLVPLSEVLERVPLLVRGLARSTGKRVELHLDAGRAEVDKSVADALLPAVLHLVRNAIDHGIESPQERQRAGKPETGRLQVTCLRESGGRIALSVSDDGRGIDRQDVARRAGTELPLDDAALLRLLARPGFSTRASATATSGRGMGMDIVRRVAEQELGGELALSTRPGRGTSFTLRVPISLAIIDCFSVVVESERYAVPVEGVEAIIEIATGEVRRGPGGGPGRVGMVSVRDRLVPLYSLASLVGLGRGPEHGKALLVRRDEGAVAVLVDRILDRHEAVLRRLEDPLVAHPGVAGATDLGDGRPVIVLDIPVLARQGRGSIPARSTEPAEVREVRR